MQQLNLNDDAVREMTGGYRSTCYNRPAPVIRYRSTPSSARQQPYYVVLFPAQPQAAATMPASAATMPASVNMNQWQLPSPDAYISYRYDCLYR